MKGCSIKGLIHRYETARRPNIIRVTLELEDGARLSASRKRLKGDPDDWHAEAWMLCCNELTVKLIEQGYYP